MKITILDKVDASAEDEIIIKCAALDDQLLGLINSLKNGSRKLPLYKNDSIVLGDQADILYFESVDDRVFAYTMDQVFESRQKLYQLEESLSLDFLRANKAVIVNINKINNLLPEFGGRIEATLLNDCKVVFSRMYVPNLKKRLGL